MKNANNNIKQSLQRNGLNFSLMAAFYFFYKLIIILLLKLIFSYNILKQSKGDVFKSLKVITFDIRIDFLSINKVFLIQHSIIQKCKQGIINNILLTYSNKNGYIRYLEDL